MSKNYHYYFAYGMNTNFREMKLRCKDAIPMGHAVLKNHRFDFKFHATVSKDFRNDVDGVLWYITDEDELALDKLEGWPRYYQKKIVRVSHEGITVPAMTYYIPEADPLGPPSSYYYDMIVEGYRNFEVPEDQLKTAKNRSRREYTKWNWRTLVDTPNEIL